MHGEYPLLIRGGDQKRDPADATSLTPEDGAGLLDGVAGFIGRFVAMTNTRFSRSFCGPPTPAP
jgi:hypothetical protein